MMPQNHKLVFLHVPKTAGTSLKVMLRTQYNRRDVCPLTFQHQFDKADRIELDAYKLFLAHIGYDTARALSGNVITVLRDPFERIVSLYYYLRNKHPDSGAGYYAKRLCFADFISLERPEIIVGIHNTQTWQIAYGHAMRYREEHVRNITDDQLYNIATKRIDEMSVVGVQDDLPSFIQRVNRVFGFSIQYRGEKVNKTAIKKPASEFLPSDYLRAVPFIHMDICLYKYVKEKIVNECGSEPPLPS